MELDRVDDSRGEVPEEYDRWFEGEARIQRLPTPFSDGPAVFAVHFADGARTRPHVHASGQLFHVVAGDGVVGTSSGRQAVRPGDVVATMPGEWHWHGAAPGRSMTHITVQVADDPIDWDVDERDWASDIGGATRSRS